MKIAVIGGGLFGCTAAIHCAKAGHNVTLFEKAPTIMDGASTANQFRLHRGYHYPRSRKTVRQCQSGNASFMEDYGRCVITPHKRKHQEQLYAIASEGSKVTASEYLTFLNQNDLPYQIIDTERPDIYNSENLDLIVRVLESFIDPRLLVDEVSRQLGESGIEVMLCTSASPEMRNHFDRIIVAAYAGTAEALKALGCKSPAYQYEVVEKCIVQMPQYFGKTGIVVMDGEFCCVDPYGWGVEHLFSHVEQSIWLRSFGPDPVIPEEVRDYIGRAVITSPRKSRYNSMVEAGVEFIPALKDAKHMGSFFTIRTVLPNKDATDERLTAVEKIDAQVIKVFSGKMGCATDAAKTVVGMLDC